MKIAIIVTNEEKQGFMPLGVLYLASYVEKYVDDAVVDVYDIFPDMQKLCAKKYDAIGFSCMSVQYIQAGAYARKLKENYNGTILVGGIHVTSTMKLPDWADVAMIGEGEQTFAEIARCSMKDGKINADELKNITGLILRDKDGKTEFTGYRKAIEDMDTIPYPAREKLDMEHYLLPNNVYGTVVDRGLNIMSSRGCVYKCEYCASSKMWGNIRFSSAEYFVNEIEKLVNTYKVHKFWVSDDHFTLNRKRLEQIADMFEERNIKIGIGAHSRIESYNDNMADLFHRIGIEEVAIGLETGSDKVLKQIKNLSKLTVKEELEVCQKIAKDGFQIHGLFMLNVPNETREDIQKTIDFIHELPLSKLSVAIAVPFYGTKWWDIGVEQGIVPKDPDENFWDTYNMKTLDERRPIFQSELTRNELEDIYRELNKYQNSLFYFDWKNRKNHMESQSSK